MENGLIKHLVQNGYERLLIPNVQTLSNNFRNQMNRLNAENLNGTDLTDTEFQRLSLTIEGKFDYHQRVYKVSDFKPNVSGKYIYYYLKRFFLKEALKNSVKATVDSLRLPTIKGMPVLLLAIIEQKMIVSVFNRIDEKIKFERGREEQLIEQKLGFMQRMFI